MQPADDGNYSVATIRLGLDYQADPVQMFRRLNGGTTTPRGRVLLESAEINSRQNLKSLMMVDPALELRCEGQQVSVQALSESGAVLLPWLTEQLSEHGQTQFDPAQGRLTVEYAPAPDNLSEAERLAYPSNVEPLRVLQQKLQASHTHPLAVFLTGVFAYDLLATFEQLPEVPTGANTCPDYVFYLAETLVVVDHEREHTELLGLLPAGPDHDAREQQLCQRMGELMARLQSPQTADSSPRASLAQADYNNVSASPSREQYAAHVESLKTHIQAGDIFQVVPARSFTLPCRDALGSYEQLKVSNPSPYMFYMQTPEFELFGASPESALKFTAESRQVELYPIAGTRSRARDSKGAILLDQDSRIELALRQDQKELAEHMMLVDLARNDLARIAKTGSRYVADLLKVDRYSHVMHLVSRVVATLDQKYDALDAYRACMNMGTLVGAPKISAARLIRDVEQQRRGSYGGAVGYLNGQGDMDTCIVIRSAFVQHGIATVQAGAGVVFDSNPDAEVRETEQKANAVIQAIQRQEAYLSSPEVAV
ncbi:anthranilate synthase component 1 [Aliidiomarina halalkaliphila]|uniref:Anthranilate synthase component 1 n=1 Tax=Aliidiomarina halalkaliphila TaxID=2593535 RepID=A0A552X4Y3_9GAMM|nr:anthranilate synthase component 1 [Aliidiomarina halalkaliphila]TRW50065.1 anthranilate synthase component 1 [Aliidiomarina halalkaliphila]